MAESSIVEQRVASLVNVSLDEISQRYVIKEELGSGAQATVYKAMNKKSAAKVAIKVIECKELEDDELFDALRMEVMLMRQLKHPNVVRLEEVVRDRNSIYLVQECLGGGELFDKLLAKGPFDEEETLTIFAQVCLAIDYMHSIDVVHRDLKAENLVFVAKGSPQIKLIDFGGAAPWSADVGLSGLVGTPQYVAPEVVTGFGDMAPSEAPYGKECDLWSLGVLLYVMLSKMMPFRAKEVDLLLKQVVKGKFSFKPEERWARVSESGKDIISKLLVVDPAKRLTIQGVKEHPWAREAIAKCEAQLPKLEAKLQKQHKANTSGFFKLDILSSSMRTAANDKRASEKKALPKKSKGVSREQQYWYAMEISPPSDMQQLGGVRVASDGTFEMDNITPEMQAVLEDIQRKKAASANQQAAGTPTRALEVAERASASGAPAARVDTSPYPPRVPSSPSSALRGGDSSQAATMHRLTAEKTAYYRHQTSDTLDTLALIHSKDDEIQALTVLAASQADQLERLEQQLEGLRAGSSDSGADRPVPAAATIKQLEHLSELQTALQMATTRAEKAEAALGEAQHTQTKLQAKLAAVTTLYTEAMQREAALKVMLENAQANQSR